MWLSSQVVEWYPRQEGSSIFELKKVLRAYSIWNHAESILSESVDEFHLIDAINTLKRSMDHRLKLLNEIYDFNKLPFGEKPKWLIEKLGYVGIVRPFLLKNLIEIRNAVEHRDAQPPSQELCSQYLDIVWYFLRSTDHLARYQTSELVLYPEDNDESSYRLDIEIKTDEDWKVEFSGEVPKEFISDHAINGWIEVEVEKITTWENSKKSKFEYYTDQKIMPDDLCLSGVILGPEILLKKIYGIYLSSFN